jgi:hypothetical protein
MPSRSQTLKPSGDTYSKAETKRRMESAIRRAQKTPHKPNKELTAKRRKSPKRQTSKASKPKP